LSRLKDERGVVIFADGKGVKVRFFASGSSPFFEQRFVFGSEAARVGEEMTEGDFGARRLHDEGLWRGVWSVGP